MINVVHPNVQSVLVKSSYIIIFIALLLVILLKHQNDWFFCIKRIFPILNKRN